MAEDVTLMAGLRANAYRFSIEWSRVEPRDGVWDEAAWVRYGQLLQLLRAARITPMVTLLHFTLPIWISERGGVTATNFPERFARFAGEAARRFGHDVELWCLINEPNVQSYLGYVEGVWPPGLREPREASRSAGGLQRAYARAAAAVRAQDPGAKLGAAINLVRFEPASRWSALDWYAARAAADTFNWGFYDAIRAGRVRFESPGFPTLDEPMAELLGSADFLGVNYYRRELLSFSPRSPGLVSTHPGPGPKTDLGWETHPEGLLLLLREAWRRYQLPIYITENGLADASGQRRGAYIRAHAYAAQRAIAEGVPVRGYFHWSLIDNFEWAEGFAPRFGLLRVDYATLARAPAGGADVFATLAPTSPIP
jgi:beta-glucosidase